jgi:hypothetical protein
MAHHSDNPSISKSASERTKLSISAKVRSPQLMGV